MGASRTEAPMALVSLAMAAPISFTRFRFHVDAWPTAEGKHVVHPELCPSSSSTTVTTGSVTQELVGSAGSAEAVAVETAVFREVDTRLERVREARMKGYEGDSCGECGNFTLVRNGTCLKCATCGSTSGCS